MQRPFVRTVSVKERGPGPSPGTPASGEGPASAPDRLPPTASPKSPVFWLIGAVGGLLSGLLGIGGGLAIAPLLMISGSMRPSEVSGTTLAAVLVTSGVGAGAYASLGHLDLSLAWPIAAGSTVGSVMGALASTKLSMRLMAVVFLVVLPYFALKEFWPAMPGPELQTHLVSLGALGATTGFVGGLLGISAASLAVPSLVGFFLLDHHAAQGIAISVALAGSIAGVTTHATVKNIRYRIVLYIAAPACVAAVAGAFISSSLSNLALRNLFGAFLVTVLVIVMARLVWDLSGRKKRCPKKHGYNSGTVEVTG